MQLKEEELRNGSKDERVHIELIFYAEMRLMI